MKTLLHVTLFAVCISICYSQPRLVKDLSTEPAGFQPAHDGTSYFTPAGDYMVFTREIRGIRSLWITDGTPEGTNEIDPRTRTSSASHGFVATIGARIFYGATEGSLTQIREYNPVARQSTLVKQLDAFTSLGMIRSGDYLIFATWTSTTTELWKSDGTGAGTVKFASIPFVGGIAEKGSDGDSFTYFVLLSSDFTYEMTVWRTDATQEGTVKITDSNGLFDPQIWELLVAGNDAYIGLSRYPHADGEYWKSDGTPEGTIKLIDTYGQPDQSVKIGSKVLFEAGGLYSTDGTPEGTGWIDSHSIDYATEYHGYYYFVTSPPTPEVKAALGRSDGTSMGTEILTDLSFQSFYSSSPYYRLNDKLLVPFEGEGTGTELGITDGTAEGTMLLKDIYPGPESSNVRQFVPIGDKMIFVADDGVHGRELWITDGTEEGTYLLLDTHPGTRDSQVSVMGDYNMIPVGDDHLAYRAEWSNEFSGSQLWITDGTGENTKHVIDGGVREIGSLNGDAYYESNFRIMKLSASTQEMTMVRDLADNGAVSGGGYTWTRHSRVVNNKLLFNQQVSGGPAEVNSGDELWVTDGTSEGTHILKDINPGSESSYPNASPLASVTLTRTNLFYFGADDGIHGYEVWSTDGTEAGTKLMADLNPGAASTFPYHFYELDDKLFFIGTDGSGTFQFWTSDGTAEGTSVAFELFENDGDNSYGIYASAKFNDHIIMSVKTAGGWELWKTDGTLKGSSKVKSFTTATGYDKYISAFVESNNHLFFTADDDVHGREFWKTDGTTEGTRIIELTEGPGGMVSDYGNDMFKDVNDLLYFVTDDGLWRTAGTTELSEKIWDGKILSMNNVNDKVYFVPSTEDYGSELFVTDFSKFSQEITFDDISDKNEGDPAFEISASTNSDLPITFSASPSDHVSISGNMISVLKPGEVTITAHQAGNLGVEPVEMSQTFCVVPAKPTISLSHRTLKSSSTVGNQWYLDGELIEGATDDEFEASLSGIYVVKVNTGECGEATSDEFPAIVTGLEEDPSLSVFPNPAKDKLVIDWKGRSGATIILDVRGNAIMNSTFTDRAELAIRHLHQGFYILRITSENKQLIRRFVKE